MEFPLDDFHIGTNCKERSTCERCNKNHPTCLHDDYKALKTNIGEQNNQASSTTNHESKHNSAQVDIEDVSNKTSQKSLKTSMIVPISSQKSLKTSMIVPISLSTTDKPYEEHLTYAISCDTMFVLEETSLMLKTKFEPSRLKLSTMTSTEMIEYR